MGEDAAGFTLGIEEEYLLVDPASGALATAPEGFLDDCRAALGDRVSPEYLDCQVEIGTAVCTDIAAARAELAALRRGVLEAARARGLAVLSASCHPFADWHAQHHTRKERYDRLTRDLAGVARRMLICGMHVHVGIPDREARIELMGALAWYLPHLLALSASSPFWQGEDTGLGSYRLTVFNDLPRTGLPPALSRWSEFESRVGILAELGILEDGTKVWWDLRPSARFPTLETRICDAQPRLEDTLTLAALVQATAHMLWRRRQEGGGGPGHDPFLIGENRWRAQRYAGAEGLIDPDRRAIVPFAQLVDEWTAAIEADAARLGCAAEARRARDMAAAGPSATRQRAVRDAALAGGADATEAGRAVVAHLAAEFAEGL